MTPPLNLAQRAAATDKVLQRYRSKPFSWAGANCIRLAATQARAMGHAVPPVPQFRTAAGAKKALSRRGAGDVAALLDLYFKRLPAPSYALMGDLVMLPGDDESGASGLDAVFIADGMGNLMGWHAAAADDCLCVVKFAHGAMLAAWRL